MIHTWIPLKTFLFLAKPSRFALFFINKSPSSITVWKHFLYKMSWKQQKHALAWVIPCDHIKHNVLLTSEAWFMQYLGGLSNRMRLCSWNTQIDSEEDCHYPSPQLFIYPCIVWFLNFFWCTPISVTMYGYLYGSIYISFFFILPSAWLVWMYKGRGVVGSRLETSLGQVSGWLCSLGEI